jgi:hypothetical protein
MEGEASCEGISRKIEGENRWEREIKGKIPREVTSLGQIARPITHVVIDARGQNSHFVKYLEHVTRGKINHSEIDEGGRADSRKCLSGEARRRVAKIGQNQIEQ